MFQLLKVIVDFLFHTIFALIGHMLVQALTFGRIDLDWRSGSDSVVAEWIGFGLIFALMILAAFLLR